MFVKNPFLTTKRRFLFFGHQRRKKLGDGYWWDIYCDPITEELDIDYLHLETRHQDSHKKPAKTGNLRYLDLIRDTGIAQKKLGFADVSFTPSERQRIRKIADSFESEFGTSGDFENMVEYHLSERKSTMWMYDRLMKRVDPEIAVITTGAYRKNFIEACKDNNIPVVELQHGVIYENNYKHDFPSGADIRVYPDYIFTFGKYWCEGVNYPIDDEKVIPVGYPYLEIESKRYVGVERRDQILFISQGTIGEELSKFAVKLDECVDGHEIVYKLHPGEYDRWRDEYPWLEDSNLRVVDSDEPPLYRLFAESKAQVGVGSTAVYEGLNFGLDTYILDAPGIWIMEGIIEAGVASVVSSVDELKDELESGVGGNSNSFDVDYFFKPNALENISDALDEILEREC